MFYITKRGMLPYSGPTWEYIKIKPKWFETYENAKNIANELSNINPVGFFVESIDEKHPEFEAGNYPLFIKKEVSE